VVKACHGRGICNTLFRPALVAGLRDALALLARMTARQGDSWKEMLVSSYFAALPVFFFIIDLHSIFAGTLTSMSIARRTRFARQNADNS
jgi:hypothetical protein